MKKKLFSLLTALVLCLLCAVPAFAEMPLVMDTYELFKPEATAELEQMAQDASAGHGVNAYLLTVSDIGGQNVREFAKDWYRDYDLGYGEGKSGILLLLLLYTLLLGTLGIHGSTDGLTCIGKERPIGAISNGRSRGVLGRSGSESSQRVETSGLSVRDLPANTILSELLLMLIVELIEFRRISLRLARANKTGNTANGGTNTTSD